MHIVHLFRHTLHLIVSSAFWYTVQYFPFFWLVAVENPGPDNLKSMVIPPPTVRDRVLKELFIEGM